MKLTFTVDNLDLKQVEAMATVHGWKPTITVEEVEVPNPVTAGETFATHFEAKWHDMIVHELSFPQVDTLSKKDMETLKETIKTSLTILTTI